tara:strand:- start:299499 stop:300845 length:1347 start_codon:yes stop_codon:yes gene_type:complete
MKRPHPDIVVGQPIPEIEPRINQPRLRLTRSLSVWWAACIVMILIMSVIRTVFSLGVEYFMFFMGATLVLWFAPLLRPTKIIEAGYRKARNGASDPDHWDIPIMDHSIHLVMTWGMMIAFSTLIMIGGFALAFALIGIYMVAGGMAVIFLARMARQPAQISCEECSYPLVGLTLPCMCPECGRSLLEATDTTDFPRVRSPWFVRVGVGMIGVGLLLAYSGFLNPGKFYKVFPQKVLGSMAVKDRDAFEQLTGSPMTPEQTQMLIESLLEESTRDELGYPQSRWLGQVYEAGGLSKSQIEAVMERVPPISIRVPMGPVRVGQEVEISLTSNEMDLASSGFRVFYFFAGFQVGDDPDLREGSDDFRIWMYLNRDMGYVGFAHQVRMNRPTYAFTPKRSGEITVRARVLVVLANPKSLQNFTWDNETNGVLETKPDWSRVLDLEAMIVVEE